MVAEPLFARELGDFGRVKPGFVNEDLLPAVERGLKRARGQAVSGFNWTDQEIEMHDRVWRFLVAPRASGWTFEEFRPANSREPVDRYYKWLKDARYASSRVRYSTLAADMADDLGTLEGVFRSICSVREVDRQRGVATDGIEALEAKVLEDQQARKAENELHIARFVAALGDRYEAYDYALNHLLAETPHEEAMLADARLSDLATWTDRADGDDFCGTGRTGRAEGSAVPGRQLMREPGEGEFRK